MTWMTGFVKMGFIECLYYRRCYEQMVIMFCCGYFAIKRRFFMCQPEKCVK